MFSLDDLSSYDLSERKLYFAYVNTSTTGGGKKKRTTTKFFASYDLKLDTSSSPVYNASKDADERKPVRHFNLSDIIDTFSFLLFIA
jgi:hypothetical protein